MFSLRENHNIISLGILGIDSASPQKYKDIIILRTVFHRKPFGNKHILSWPLNSSGKVFTGPKFWKKSEMDVWKIHPKK